MKFCISVCMVCILSVELFDDGGEQCFCFSGFRPDVPASVEVDDGVVVGIRNVELADASLPDSVHARLVEPHHLDSVGLAVDRGGGQRPDVHGLLDVVGGDFDFHGCLSLFEVGLQGFDFGFHRRDSGDVAGDAFGFFRRELEVIRSAAGEQFFDEVGIAGGDLLVGRDFVLEALDLLFRAVHKCQRSTLRQEAMRRWRQGS